MLAGALQVALFFAAAASSLLPAEAAEDGVLLRGEKMTSEGFQFFFGAAAGQTYPVASSTDLLHWTALTNLSGPGGLLSVVDPDAPDFPQRFFRIGAIPTPITNMVYLPPGTFTMGSPAAETGHETNEAPRTVVTLSRGFWIAKYEVTQAEYTSLMGSNIALFAYDLRLPVDFATWFHATNYCQRLTETERAAGRLPAGYSYRLPTEAEWEYACRAGRTSPFGVGDGTSLSSTQANFDGRAVIAGGTQSIRTSTGVELQIMMPVVNAPFRLYWAYNPNIVRQIIQPPVVVDRSAFPNEATFNNAVLSIGQPSPLWERRTMFRFSIGRTF